MKTEGQTRQKLKQVFFRHLKRHLSEKLEQAPHNCLYNRKVWGRDRPVDTLHVCIHAERAGVICQTGHPQTVEFERCPFFTPKESKEKIKADFVELARLPRDRVAETMPDAAALMWVLDQEAGVSGPVMDPEPANLQEADLEDKPVRGATTEVVMLDEEASFEDEPDELVVWTPEAPFWKFWLWPLWGRLFRR